VRGGGGFGGRCGSLIVLVGGAWGGVGKTRGCLCTTKKRDRRGQGATKIPPAEVGQKKFPVYNSGACFLSYLIFFVLEDVIIQNPQPVGGAGKGKPVLFKMEWGKKKKTKRETSQVTLYGRNPKRSG